MNKINIFVFMVLAFTTLSCEDKSKIEKGSTVKLSFLDNGKISQAGSEKVEQHRLFFSYSNGKTVYSGSQKVHSYKAVNKDSLPEEQKSNYYGFALYNKNQKIIHKGLLPKSYFWKSFEKRPEYKISYYTGTFFLDIPISIDLDDISQFAFVNLKNNKVEEIGDVEDSLKMFNIKRVESIVNIEDPLKIYKEPEEKAEGWNQELFIYKIYGSSSPENAFDFVLLTEGFTKEELQADDKESLMNSKFGNYVKKYVFPLLETEPYKSRKNNINIWVVATPSKDSGVSNPFQNKNRNTVYRASYGTHCFERALTVRDQVRALEMASLTPFDQILVLVNDKTYGGIGLDIATFSINKSTPYLIKHELAHSVGMMADEYNYYFNETKLNSNCENNLLESYVSHIHKNWGKNIYHEDDARLAPNISNIADPSKVKWKNFLNEESPIVYFNYSENAIEFDKESFSLKGKYKSQFNKEKALITFGPSQYERGLISRFIEKVIVNDKSEPFDIYQKEDQFFIKLPNFSLEKDQVVILELVLKDNSETRGFETSFEYAATSYHFITMPSKDFTGKTTEVGIFQGSYVDLYKTFRSSYNNIMTFHQSLNFDPWQEYSYGLIIDSYISKANNH